MPAVKRKRPYGGFTKRQPYRTKQRTMYGGRKQFTPRTLGPFAQSETKYFDFGIEPTAIAEGTTWAGTELDSVTYPANTLFAPEQGTGINQRVGRKVHLHKIALRGLITNAVLTDQADIVSSPATRVIVYIDTQTNGTFSQGEDIMQAGIVVQATVDSAFNSFQNVNNFGRYRVLKDVIYTPRIVTAGTDGTNTNSMVTSQHAFKMTIPFKTPLEVRFDGTTAGGSVADIVNNSIHLIATKSGTSFASTMSYYGRAYYKDG